MSLVVIATKLSQPFDDVVRLPENDLDPTATKIDWIKWRDIMTEHTDETLKPGDELCVTDSDVLNMTGKQMDEWMNWYHRTWIDDRDQKSMRQITLYWECTNCQQCLSKYWNYSLLKHSQKGIRMRVQSVQANERDRSIRR
jgi:hypothetical protein